MHHYKIKLDMKFKIIVFEKNIGYMLVISITLIYIILSQLELAKHKFEVYCVLSGSLQGMGVSYFKIGNRRHILNTTVMTKTTAYKQP